MKRKSLLILGICLISLLAVMPILASCATSATTTTPAPTTAAPAPTTAAPAPTTAAPAPTTAAPKPTTAAPAPAKTLKIGFVYNAQMMLDAKRSLAVLIDNANAKGGIKVGADIYKLQLVDYDSMASQTGANSAVNRLVYQDNVKFILHDFMFVAGYLPITEANKVIAIGGSPDFSPVKGGLNYSFAPDGRDFEVAIDIAWYVKNNPDKVVNYVIAAPDDATGHSTVDVLMAPTLEKLGVNLHTVYYPTGTTDMSAVATKVLSLNPTTVDCTGGSNIADIMAMKSIWQGGYRGQFFTTGSVDPANATQFLSAEGLNGSIAASNAVEYDPPLTQIGKDLVAGWIAKYGKWESPGVSTDEFLCLMAAMQQAGSTDVDKIMAVVYNGFTFQGLNGTNRMVERPDLGDTQGKTRGAIKTCVMHQYEGATPKLFVSIPPEEGVEYYKMVYPDFSTK